MEPIRFTFTVEADPTNPAHREWLDSFAALVQELAAADGPQLALPGQRMLGFDEFVQVMRHTSHIASTNYRKDGLRMWKYIVQAYGARTKQYFSLDNAQEISLPLYELMRLKRADFDGTRAIHPTRISLIELLNGIESTS